MRRAVIAMLVALALVPARAYASQTEGAQVSQNIEQALDAIDFSGWDALLQEPFAPGAKNLARNFAAGSPGLDPLGILDTAVGLLLASLRSMLPLGAVLLGLCAAACVLERMQASFAGDISRIAKTVCFFLAALPAVKCFSDLFGQSIQAAQRLTSFTGALMPTLLAVLSAAGGTACASALQPLSAGALSLANRIFSGFVLEALSALAALSMVSSLSGSVRIGKLCKIIRTLCNCALVGALSVFAAVLLATTASAPAADSAALRATRYALDNFVPVVGGFFKDTFAMLAGSCFVIKNAVGAAGLLWILLLCARPLLDLASAMLLFRGCAALIEIMGAQEASQMLEEFAGVFSMLFACVISCAALFLMLVSAAVSCGGGALNLGV